MEEKVIANILEDNRTVEVSLENGFKDDSIYEITLKFESATGDIIEKTFSYCTKLNYMFVDVIAVENILGDLTSLSSAVIMYNIREASRYAEYIKGMQIDENNIPFEVTQFVKYKAAYECLLRHTVALSSSTGISGKVGNVSFEEKTTTKDIQGLLKSLADLIKQWQDEVKGYKLEGRAPMNYGVRGNNASPRFGSIGSTGTSRGFF